MRETERETHTHTQTHTHTYTHTQIERSREAPWKSCNEMSEMKWLIHFCLCGHGYISFSILSVGIVRINRVLQTLLQAPTRHHPQRPGTHLRMGSKWKAPPCIWHSCHKAMCCPHFVIHSYSFRDLRNAFCGLRFGLVTGEFKWVRQVSGILGARRTKEGRGERGEHQEVTLERELLGLIVMTAKDLEKCKIWTVLLKNWGREKQRHWSVILWFVKSMKICLIHTLRFGVDLEESGKPFHNGPGLSACTW